MINRERAALPAPPLLEWAVLYERRYGTWAVMEWDSSAREQGQLVYALYPLRVGPETEAPVAWAAVVTGVDITGWRMHPRKRLWHTAAPRGGRPLPAWPKYTCAIVHGTHWVGSLHREVAEQVARGVTRQDALLRGGQSPAVVMDIDQAVGLAVGWFGRGE